MNIKFELPHSLNKEEALKRIGDLLEYWTTKYSIKSSWSGDSATVNGKVKGIQFDATLRVGDKAVAGEATDPGILFRGMARKYLEHKLGDFLDPAKNPADLMKKAD